MVTNICPKSNEWITGIRHLSRHEIIQSKTQPLQRLNQDIASVSSDEESDNNLLEDKSKKAVGKRFLTPLEAVG